MTVQNATLLWAFQLTACMDACMHAHSLNYLTHTSYIRPCWHADTCKKGGMTLHLQSERRAGQRHLAPPQPTKTYKRTFLRVPNSVSVMVSSATMRLVSIVATVHLAQATAIATSHILQSSSQFAAQVRANAGVRSLARSLGNDAAAERLSQQSADPTPPT